MLVVPNLVNKKMTETLSYGKSSESNRHKLLNEYQNDRV